jgi:hypothetical protein
MVGWLVEGYRGRGEGLACSVGKVGFFGAEEGVAGEVGGGEEAGFGVWFVSEYSARSGH